MALIEAAARELDPDPATAVLAEVRRLERPQAETIADKLVANASTPAAGPYPV